MTERVIQPGDEPSTQFPGLTVRQALEMSIRNREELIGAMRAAAVELGIDDPEKISMPGADGQGREGKVTLREMEQALDEERSELNILLYGALQGMKLAPMKSIQRDLFVADIIDPAVKDDTASMEHPVFSLSKKRDLRERVYERNGNKLTITPSIKGAATIWDKDVIIYLASQLVEAANRKRQDISRRVRVVVYDLLTATNRGTSGRDYDRLKEALDRLAGTRLKTNIETGGAKITHNFGLIDEYTIVEQSPDNTRMVALEVTLSKWFYNAIRAKEVLTLDRDYFRMTGGIERRVYEIARKHCGSQPKFIIGIEALHHKSGSQAQLKKFRHDIVRMTGGGLRKMLGYVLYYSREKDQLLVVQDSPAGQKELSQFVANLGRFRSLKARAEEEN